MEKQVEILSGLEADDKNNKVKIDLKGAGEESESGLTVSINFYLLRETFCTVFAAEDFKVQVEGTALIVYYKNRSLFGQALIYRYLNVNQVQTVDICSRGGKIELYINCAKIGEADLTEKFILKDSEETFIGGSRYCFVRWFRIYRETLNGAEIRKRVLGNETLESDQANFDKKPALYYDFTGRDDTSGQGISMCGTSRIVQLHECLQMESRGTVLLIPGIPLFQERDTSIRFTIKPGIVSMKEECLFHIGAAGVFALLVRENEEGKRFLDIEIQGKKIQGTQPLPNRQWVDLSVVKAGDELVTYVNEKRDISTKETLPQEVLSGNASWYLGDGKGSYTGYISDITSFDLALNEDQIGQMLSREVNRYSGRIRLYYRFRKSDLGNKVENEIFFSKNTCLVADVNKLKDARSEKLPLMSFQDDSVKFPENEREKMAICYEFLVQEWKEMFGVTIGQKMEELTETQLCEFRPYLDGIVAIYNREALASAGVKLPAADGEDDDYLVVFPAMVLLGLVVTTSSIICATFLASLPAYWIAAFGTPMGIQISLDVAAVGLAITTGAALAWATVTFFGGGGGEGGGGEGGGSEGEGGSGECSPLTISFTKLCFIVDAKKPEKSGVYIRRNDTEKAKDELAVEECTSKTPGSACFIREILKSPVSVKAFFKNSSGKGTFHLYPTVTIGGQRISVGDVEGEFSETENYVVLNLSAADLVREDQARIAISFRGIDKSGIVKAVEQSADVLSCVFDKLPALPFNVTDAEKAPALSDFERYKELKGAVKGGLTAMAIARDLRARYEIERRAASACVAEGASGTLDVVYSEMKKIFAVGETTGKVKCACNSLEFGVMYWMTCALCGIQVNILKVVSPLAPVCMDGTRVAPAFPLEFPSGFLGNGNNLSLFEYYLPESWNEAKGCFVPYDVFSEVPNTQEYSFAGRTKSFYYPVKDSYQSQMIACGTPARVAEYYSDCNLVECLPRIDVKDGAVGENGFAKEEALITYDGKEKQFVLQDGSLDLDPVFLNTMGEDEIQERIGLDVIGRLLVNFINQGFGSEQKSAAGKLTGLLQMIVSGGLPVAYTEIETVLNDRMEALETMLEGADTVQILNAANLILAGCRNLPANFVMSGNLWKRDAASYSPAEWFYYSDHRVWAYEGGIFEDGISYKNFKEENLGVGKVEKELEEGIYLTSVYDQIRLGYIIENLKDFKGVRLYYKLLRGKEGRKIIFVANAACNTFQYNPYDYQEYRLSAEMVRDPEMRWIHLKI